MNRNKALDFFKGIAVFLVICLHVPTFYNLPIPNFVLNTVMRFAVPLFFVISGYLLFNKIKNREKFGRAILISSLKSLKYYIISLVAAFGIDVLMFGKQMAQGLKALPMKALAYYGPLTPNSFHLWYLIAAFWSLLIVWAFCRNNLHNIKKVLIIGALLHFAGMFLGNQPLNFKFAPQMLQREALFFGLFYTALGCYLGLYPEKLDRLFRKGSSLTLILLFSLAQFVERSALVFARFDFKTQYADSMPHWGEFFFFTLPLTLAILKYALDNGDRFKNNIFTKAGEKTLIIYIGHVFIMNVFLMIISKNMALAKFMMIVPVMVFLISLGIAMIFDYIKGLFNRKELVEEKA